VYSAQPPEDFDPASRAPLTGANLGGRLYLAIRPCTGTEGETVREAQDRLAKEIWRRVEVMDYKRPMA
jgi:myo-inositol-1(or 4)-monophosphatase